MGKIINSDFQPPERLENKFLLSTAPSLWYFVIVAQLLQWVGKETPYSIHAPDFT
jgi:hypothetical protein